MGKGLCQGYVRGYTPNFYGLKYGEPYLHYPRIPEKCSQLYTLTGATSYWPAQLLAGHGYDKIVVAEYRYEYVTQEQQFIIIFPAMNWHWFGAIKAISNLQTLWSKNKS